MCPFSEGDYYYCPLYEDGEVKDIEPEVVLEEIGINEYSDEEGCESHEE